MFVDKDLVDFSVFVKEHGPRIEWPPVLIPLRDRIEKLTGVEFGVCVCIYYRDGEVESAYHSDPSAFGSTVPLPSLSLGATRTFGIRRVSKPSEEYFIELPNGCMVVMGEGFQENFEHAVPIDKTCKEPRINLTFRQFGSTKNGRRESASVR